MRILCILALLINPVTISADEIAQISTEKSDEYWVLASTKAPVYPSPAIQEGISGHVRFEFTIDGNGKVRDVEVIESVPPGVFDRSALRAFRKFRFEPAEANSDRTPIRTEFKIDFNLN